MKTIEYKIEDIHRLLSNSTLTGVILAENNPEFVDKNQTTIVNDKYTWYAYTPDIHWDTYTDYHAEKLALTETDGKILIDKWNTKINAGTLTAVSFSKIITTSGKLKFGVIPLEDPDKVIVMMDRFSGHKQLFNAGCGCNGYTWQYLDPNIAPTDQQLLDYFNLNKNQRERFRDQW